MMTFESWLVAYLINSLWQIPLVWLAGWIAARLVRPAGPAAEHRVWVAALCMQTVVPIASTFSWQPVWARLATIFAGESAGSASVRVLFGPGITVDTARQPASLLALVGAVYLLVSLWFATRFMWRCAQLRVLRNSARPLHLPEDAARIFEQCSRRLRAPGVALASSKRIAGPIALGIRRPLILFPEPMTADLDCVDLETVLAHELAHLHRRDFLTNLLCEALALPIAWHPAVWLTRQRIAESRELACDRMAAEVSGSIAYTRSLLRLASRLVPGAPLTTPHALGIFDTAIFERRLMRLTEHSTPLNRARRFTLLAACAALGLITCGSALALALHPAGIPEAAASAPHKLKAVYVSSGVEAGQRISGKAPVYPPDAKKAHIQGTVVLHVTINKKGKVEQIDVVSGPQELQQSSVDAVRTWKYKPFLLNGEPVAVNTEISVVYSLSDDSAKVPPPPPQKQ